MPLLALALVLASCGLHAFWNLLFKQAHNKMAFTALFLSITPVLYLPMLVVLLPRFSISLQGWGCIFGTGVLYFGYFISLARAYTGGELSFAYPLARGLGPALTLAWGVLFLGEHPTPPGVLGILLIVFSVALLHWQPGMLAGQCQGWRTFISPSSLAAMLVGLMYSLYSLVDKVGVGRLHIHPALYIYLTYSLAAVMVTPWVIRTQGLESLRIEWNLNRRSCVAVAALNLLAYMMVLFALSLPHTPVSYVVPLRTVSVLLGVVLGSEVLHERAPWTRWIAAILIMVGVALVAWKG